MNQNNESEEMTPERREELLVCLKEMSDISNDFYRRAIHVHNHAFIEFTGFMNEYIKLCSQALEQGIDFTDCNTHTGNTLKLANFHVDYINEKMDCIFSGQLEVVRTKLGKELITT